MIRCSASKKTLIICGGRYLSTLANEIRNRTQDGREIDFVLERDRQKLFVEVKSMLARETIPPAIRNMLARDDALGAIVLNDRIHDRRNLNGKPVLFLPLALTHCIPDYLRCLADQ